MAMMELNKDDIRLLCDAVAEAQLLYQSRAINQTAHVSVREACAKGAANWHTVKCYDCLNEYEVMGMYEFSVKTRKIPAKD